MPWNNLGVMLPTRNIWTPYSVSQGSGNIFRLTFTSPSFTRLNSFGWLHWKFLGGSEPLPPTRAIKIYPDFLNRLLCGIDVTYPPELISLGYTTRQFYLKKSVEDTIYWSMQIEELI